MASGELYYLVLCVAALQSVGNVGESITGEQESRIAELPPAQDQVISAPCPSEPQWKPVSKQKADRDKTLLP